MSTGHIGNYQLKASSYFDIGNIHFPGAGRYGSVVNGVLLSSWIPKPITAADQWIQVDLMSPHVVTRKVLFFLISTNKI